MSFFRLKVAFGFLWYYLNRPHRNGHGIHSPFLFAFLQEVVYSKIPENSFLTAIKRLKMKVTESKEFVIVDDLGAGSNRLRNSERSISKIAGISSISHKYGRLLHKTVRYFKPEIIIELGTCLGFGSMYMASGYEWAKVITIEGSEALVKKSLENFSLIDQDNITVIHGSFDEVLPSILQKNKGFNLIFIDGNHQKTEVLGYFKMCLPYITSDSIIIVDDIRWSMGMLEAWREICKESHVTLSIDLFRMGIVFFNSKLKKQHFKIYY